MDNLTHAAFGSLLGVAVAPVSKQTRFRWFILSMLLANMPDLDILFLLFGKEAYMFEHRGFTHSISGLIPLTALGYWFYGFVLKPCWNELPALAKKPWFRILFVMMQLVISHVFLDYLTSYGTMILYPFLKTKFTYPLIFIIDPFLWVLLFSSVYFTYQKPLRLRAVLGLSSVMVLLLGYAFIKKQAESIYVEHRQANKSPETKIIESYPAPLSPLLWSVLSKDQNDSYYQGYISMLRFWQNRNPATLFGMPEPITQDAFCPDFKTSEDNILFFEKYKNWASYIICKKNEVCHCTSLKYSVPILDFNVFGEAIFTENSRLINNRADFKKTADFYQAVLF